LVPARRAGSGLADSRWARRIRYSWVRWPPVVHSEHKFQSHPTVPPGRLIEYLNLEKVKQIFFLQDTSSNFEKYPEIIYNVLNKQYKNYNKKKK
jgi:hypothetical protein